MKKQEKFYLLGLSLVFVLSGCVVRTYPVVKDRVDQDLGAGNRGYLKGQVPAGEMKERRASRTTRVVEIELHSPIKFESMPKTNIGQVEPIQKTGDQGAWGNRGFITQTNIPETTESIPQPSIQKYTVQKGDTLQKISRSFYGTTKKWTKIYEANKNKLKGPNKIYPGQVIDIPVEPLKETKENLK